MRNNVKEEKNLQGKVFPPKLPSQAEEFKLFFSFSQAEDYLHDILIALVSSETFDFRDRMARANAVYFWVSLHKVMAELYK